MASYRIIILGIVGSEQNANICLEWIKVECNSTIVRLDGRAVASSSSLCNAIGLLRVSTRIKLTVMRKGKQLTLRAVLADPLASSTVAGTMSKHRSGAVPGAISDNHPLAGPVDGVQVLEIERGSPAWLAGLRADDIVVSINQLPVTSMNDMAAAVKRNPDAMHLNIRRESGALLSVFSWRTQQRRSLWSVTNATCFHASFFPGRSVFSGLDESYCSIKW